MPELNEFATELFRIISGALKLDVLKVRNYSSFLADKLEAAGEASTAARLRKLLQETDHELRPADFRASAAVPIDSETRFPLVERITLDSINDVLILTQEQSDLVSEFVSVAKSQGQLESQGMVAQSSLLLYGPPGCGKTCLAHHIAKELQLPLYLARIDGLISSFLGNTAKNIRAVLEFASKGPCVLLLDEFDAIAKLRDDKQELGELKRVVNSFLQTIDSLGPQTVIIAASNHPQLLDPAVWRRFTYTLPLLMPKAEQRKQIWSAYLKLGRWSDHDFEIFTDLSDGFTGAEIKEVCMRLRRQTIVHKIPPDAHGVFVGLGRLATPDPDRSRFMTNLNGLDNMAIATALRKRDSRLYSHAAIAGLLGVSKATAFRLTVKSERGKRHGRQIKG